MKRYSADEAMEIARETGDTEVIARFSQYATAGYFATKVKRPKGKFKPFGAATGTLAKIKKFPVWVAPKYDGFRGILHPEFGLITKQSKPIKNHYVRETLESYNVWHLDGEIVTYTDGKIDGFSKTQSKLSSEEGKPEFRYFVFDDFEFPNLNYQDRMANAIKKVNFKEGEIVVSSLVHDNNLLDALEDRYSRRHEGIIVRNPDAPYKFGKATLREGGLTKIKRFLDDEGVILAVNQLSDGSFGVGSFTVKWKGIIFNLGNGWTDAEGKEMWRRRHELVKAKVTFKYQEIGANGAPRFSSFLGIRHDA